MTHTLLTHALRAHRARCRLLVAAAVVASAFSVAVSARADVTADGDVTPAPGPLPTGLFIDGGTITVPVVVGVTDIGILTIDVPAFTDPLVSPSGTIGLGVEAIGIANISGLLSEWTVEDFMYVGVEGQGYLNITSGARVETDVAATPADPDAVVGQLEGSQGFVTINGIGSRWRHNIIRIGDEGNGNVTVSGGGRLETLDDAYVGYERQINGTDNALGVGYVEVTGTGSRWNIENDLTVARQGRAEIYVRGGGMIDVRESATMATIAGSFGSITVADLNSTFWTRDDLTVGSIFANAYAQLHIDNGGLVRIDRNLTIGPNGLVEFYTGLPNQPVSVLLVNGTFTNNGVIRGSGRIEHPGALINNGDIRNATYTDGYRERLYFTGSVTNNDNIESVGGEMEFDGTVNNATAQSEIVGIDAILRFNGGLTNPGALFLDNSLVWSPTPILSTGSIALAATESSLAGGLQLGPAHTFSVEIGDDFSRLEISDVAILDGILEISLADDYAPVAGDVFEIIQAGGISGTFDNPPVAPNISGFDFTVTYDTSSVFINVIAGFEFSADFNSDNVINGADLDIWRMNVGMMVPPGTLGDADGDGDVDGNDFMIWQRTLGPVPVVPAVGAVPEPGSLALAASALAMVAACRRRRTTTGSMAA